MLSSSRTSSHESKHLQETSMWMWHSFVLGKTVRTVTRGAVPDRGAPVRPEPEPCNGAAQEDGEDRDAPSEKDQDLLERNTSKDPDAKVGAAKRRSSAGTDAPPKKKKRRRSPEGSSASSAEAQRAAFEAKYVQLHPLGEGGCGCVYAGYRAVDDLPVAIKHVPSENVMCKHVRRNGRQVSVEVAAMLKLRAGRLGMSAAVSLLDWYDLEQELILVLERPVPTVDLLKYKQVNGGSLQEAEAKAILRQLIGAAAELQEKKIFHRDIKMENVLIETGSGTPRVRLIDFGLSCFVKKTSHYRVFYGTAAQCPPECLSRCTYRAGPSTVWQLGVVLYEMLHANARFQTKEFLRGHVAIGNKLSKGCQNFLKICLCKDPEQRPSLKQLQHQRWLQ